MARRKLTAARRLAFFRSSGEMCSLCKGKIDGTREAWEIEHTIPVEMGGKDDETNWTIVHAKCHKVKSKTDAKNLAKAKRREARHQGVPKAPKVKIKVRPKVEETPPKYVKPRLPPRQLYQEVKKK